MCGRYELHSHPVAIALAFGLAHPPDLEARYNIAPMSDVPVVRVNADGQRELVMLRWGLVPRAAKDPSVGAKIINARGETVAERASFRMPYRRHRCLLPANGFYEWHTVARGTEARKQPLHIGMKDGVLFGLAGLYERWLSAEGEVLDTCTVITTSANTLLHPRERHAQRRRRSDRAGRDRDGHAGTRAGPAPARAGIAVLALLQGSRRHTPATRPSMGLKLALYIILRLSAIQ